MLELIFQVFNFVKNGWKMFKTAKMVLTVISLVSSTKGVKHTIEMQSFNGINITMIVEKDKTNDVEIIENVKPFELENKNDES